MHTLSHQKNWVRCHTKGENSKKGTSITNGSKNGFVPPVNLRSESANNILMELKYFLKGSKSCVKPERYTIIQIYFAYT